MSDAAKAGAWAGPRNASFSTASVTPEQALATDDQGHVPMNGGRDMPPSERFGSSGSAANGQGKTKNSDYSTA